MNERPTVFSRLRGAPLPEGLADAVSRGVAEALERESRPAPLRLAWAAALLLAVGVGWLATSAPERSPAARPVTPPRAAVTLQSDPDRARVVDLTVGETRVVMIFDEEMDL